MTIQAETQDSKILQDAGALRQRVQTINNSVEVAGGRSKHLGPRFEFAKVDVRLEPACKFEVIDLVEPNKIFQKLDYPENFIRGILELIMASNLLSIIYIKIIIMNVCYDNID